MDVRQLEFEKSSFDVAIDKGQLWRVWLSTFKADGTLRYHGRNDDLQRRCLGMFSIGNMYSIC
jgi:hypothetical protein